MNYQIAADSSSNVFSLEGASYAHVPLKIIAGDQEYVDTPSLDVFAMLEDLKSVKDGGTTSCPNAYEWRQAFGDADGVFAVTITSALSGSWAAANQARQDYEAAHPGARVSVIDTLSVGPEMQLVLEKLRDLIQSGLDFDAIDREIREYLGRTHMVFFLESLENMARNGRVSPAVAKLVGVLGIRIVCRASQQGTLEPIHKCRGEKKALAAMYQDMKDHGYVGGRVRIHHCLNLGAAVALKEMILADHPDADVQLGACTGLCSYYAQQGGVLVGYEEA